MTKGSVRARIATSLVLVFPLLLAYEIGVVFSERMNGVDFLTRALVWVAQGDKEIYLVAHLAVASVYLGAIFLLRGKTKVELGGFLPMLLESSIYALTLGTMIVFVMENLHWVDPSTLEQVSVEPQQQPNRGDWELTYVGDDVLEIMNAYRGMRR